MITETILQNAIVFAVERHRGQKRKGDKRPYIMHPMSVMLKIYNTKESENKFLLAAAAILHDTVEDCGVQIEEIAREFGYQVAALVQELTLDKEMYEKIGKKEYLAQEMIKMSSYALCIKLCDRLDNVQDMKDMSDSFIASYVPETEYLLQQVTAKRTKLTQTHLQLMSEIQHVLLTYKPLLNENKTRTN